MAETKNKIITVESLKAKHDYDESTYLKKSGALTTLGITATAAELNYVDGVTSNVQTQLNNKLSLSGGTVTGNVTLSGSDLYTTDIYITDKGGGKGNIYGLTSDGAYISNFQPCNENDNCVVGWGGFNRGVGSTNIYGAEDINMILGDSDYHVFTARNIYNNMQINYSGYMEGNSKTYIYGTDIYLRPAAAEFKPYFAAGDTISFNLATAGYVTNGSTEVCFTLPISKPIIGSPTLTVTTDKGIVLRQNSKYTHGSSSSAGAVPTSYTLVAEAGGTYINVRAKFATTTNATNNDAIGVSWGGTITLS